MKFLGIDYGTKRVGIALSDDTGSMAFPKTVLENTSSLVADIQKLIEIENVEGVVVGESNNLDGTPNLVMQDIQAFKESLKKTVRVPVYLEPEFFSSAEAERLQGKNTMLDASAAAIILKSFLDKKANGVITDKQ